MNKFGVGFITLVSIIIIGLLAFYAYQNDKQLQVYKKEILGAREDYAKLAKKFQNLRQLVVVSKTADSKSSKISEIIYNYATKIDGDISIYYKNLTSDETVTIGGDKTYYMASLYKVTLTLFILDKITNNEIKFSDKLSGSDTTIEQALNKIIEESNNEYANILADSYGWTTIAKRMRDKLEIDFNFTEKLEISAENVGRLFENIAISLNIPKNESSYILKLLGDQKHTRKLPKYLPESIYSHNKTGEFEEYSHDAGIFYTPKANYILVFLSKTKNPGETNEQMSLMSKEIYESLNGLAP